MADLLRQVIAQYPKAKVIVTGYYHIFSSESRVSSLTALYLSLNDGEVFPTDPPETTCLKLSILCGAWVSESNKNLAAAVKSVNDGLVGEPRVFFVDPETTPENAAHAPESLLWEPGLLGGAQDPMRDVRKQQCEDHKDRLKSEHATWGNGYTMSKRNSSYHPNPAGAQRYFEKMCPVLDLTAKEKRVALRCASGHYLTAEGGGNGPLVANRTALGPWETFDWIDLGNSQAALRSISGLYVCAESGGGQDVTVTRGRIGAWETFTLLPQGAGFALRTSNGHYLSATSGGGGPVVGSAGQITGDEVFSIL